MPRTGFGAGKTMRDRDHFEAQPNPDPSLVRVLSKGLHLLRVLNEHYELSAVELGRLTGLPRPTVHRLLNTLIADGYVAAAPETRRYRATISVQALSQGFREESWVADVAHPVLQALQRDIIWPSDVATYRDGAMVIRQTTNNTSPVSIVGERVGSRIHVLKSAIGRAFVAFSEPATQNLILDILAAPDSLDYDVARDRDRVRAMLTQIREEGHAERVGGIVPRTFSFGVPIMVGETCFAALNVICISSAVKIAEARTHLLPKMRVAATKIAAQLRGSA